MQRMAMYRVLTGVATATKISAINNTNTVSDDKIATNTANIAHTIALADDNGHIYDC